MNVAKEESTLFWVKHLYLVYFFVYTCFCHYVHAININAYKWRRGWHWTEHESDEIGIPKWSYKLSVQNSRSSAVPAHKKMLYWEDSTEASLKMKAVLQPGLCWDCKQGLYCACMKRVYICKEEVSGSHSFMTRVWPSFALLWTLTLPWAGC